MREGGGGDGLSTSNEELRCEDGRRVWGPCVEAKATSARCETQSRHTLRKANPASHEGGEEGG